MNTRTVLALGGIVLVVAGLAAWRNLREEGPRAPVAAPVAAPDAAPAPSPAALPRILDFGRDT